MATPDAPEAVARAGALLGRRPMSWRTPVFGLSAAARYVVAFDDGTSAFVKAAADDQTDAWLRTEHAALQTVGGHLGPHVIAFDADAGRSLLVTEDLSHGYWPAHDHVVEWRPGDVDALLEALRHMAAAVAPADLGPVKDWPQPHWDAVFRSEMLTANGLCSAEWAQTSAPAITAIDEAATFEPTALVHGDVRSDNAVIIDGRAVLVDWSTAGMGNAGHDLAQLLPTLHLEGAVEPWRAANLPAALVVRLSGSVAARLVNPQGIPDWLQRVLLRVTAIDLAWIAVLLELDPPDGLDWRDI